MNRKEIADQFYIEEHAVLFACLVKAAVEVSSEKGRLASMIGTQVYGKERGARMALRVLKDGLELTPENYMIYGEWTDPKGHHVNDLIQKYPEYHLFVKRCAWTEAWKKYDLLEYGQLYCPWIDECLEEGYNNKNRIDVDTFLSFGANCCNFKWVGVSFKNEAEFEHFKQRRQEVSQYAAKDFLYHSGHLLWSMKRTYLLELGAAAAAAIAERAVELFRSFFGDEKTEALLAEENQDFMRI